MTSTHAPSADPAAQHGWTDPTLPQPDEVTKELLGLAQAARALRDVMGPTFSVEEVSHFVRWLVNEAKALTPQQRQKAAAFVREGMSVADALTVAVLVRPGADQ
jgi:hypothetical protein